MYAHSFDDIPEINPARSSNNMKGRGAELIALWFSEWCIGLAFVKQSNLNSYAQQNHNSLFSFWNSSFP